MTRLPLFLLLLGLAAPALAQPTPDTTDAWRYLPLDDGNVWEYTRTGLFSRLERRAVEGDTLVDGETYARYRVIHYDTETQEVTFDQVWPIRFDTLQGRLITTEDALPGLTPCPLDAPFGATGFCPDGCLTTVLGGEADVTIGTDVVHTVVKEYDAEACEVVSDFAPDIGYLGDFSFTGQLTLAYARIRGVEYGAPVVVASEPPAGPASGLAVRVAPNPSAGRVTVELQRSAPQPLTVEVFDARARRVHAAVVPAGSDRLALDASAWAPGVYVVRVTAADGQRATARLVRP